MANFKDVIGKLNNDYNAAMDRNDTTTFWNLSTTFQEYEEALREHIQEITKDQIQEIINKLRNSQQLSVNELEYVKLWIVGEADYYVKLENNYKDWIDELKRLVDEINKNHENEPDFICASKQRAMLLDGIRVAGDIVFFVKQQQRIKNFTESTQEIDPEERSLLIRLLEGKIRSPRE